VRIHFPAEAVMQQHRKEDVGVSFFGRGRDILVK
jgi:hypothetical protein